LKVILAGHNLVLRSCSLAKSYELAALGYAMDQPMDPATPRPTDARAHRLSSL